MIDLLLLGNGSMQPLPNRWLSSLLVRCGSDLLLFDCGEGTQIVYRTFGWGYRRLSTICLSHCHADHVTGLPGILFSLANAGRIEPVHIYGPAGTRRIVEGLCVVCGYLPFELYVGELSGGDALTLPGGLRASVVDGIHRGTPVVAWRFDLPRQPRFNPDAASAIGLPRRLWNPLQKGESVAWNGEIVSPAQVMGPPRRGLSFGVVTDTRPLPAFADHFRDVDWLMSEATYLDHADLEKAQAFDHMTMREACTMAETAGAKRLLLSHFSAAYPQPLDYTEEARRLMPGAEIGYSGWTTTLNFDED